MNQDAIKTWKQIKNLDDHRVLLGLLELLDYDNLIIVNQTKIAKGLGMHQPHVNRAIKRLIEYGAVIKGPRSSHQVSYRLNPDWGWKGSNESHLKVIQGSMGKQPTLFPE